MIPIQKKKLFIIIGTFIMFVAIVSVIYLYFNNSASKNSQGPSTVIIYTDPGHYGIERLYDLGITTAQLDSLKLYFSAYASAQKTPVKEIVISNSSMKQTIYRETGVIKLTFTIETDSDSVLDAQTIYTGLDDITLNLYDSISGVMVYTSDSSGN